MVRGRLGRFREAGLVSAEIKQYPGVFASDKTHPEQPVAEVIEVIEALLADAREGRIRAIAYAAVTLGHPSYGWAMSHWRVAHEMRAAISDLSFACSMERYEVACDREAR